MFSNLNYCFDLLERCLSKMVDLFMSDIFSKLVLSNNEKK